MKIELRNLAKKYENRQTYTLENINLTIDSGDFCVILGPSGCGKSTLLKMIAGLNSITKGDLLFDKVRVNGLAPKERDIAMVFQSYALYPHMSNYQNIAFGLKMQKERKDIIDQRVKNVAQILQVKPYLLNKPADISGGQRQRIALGRALARKPRLFLMDEPLSNLDAKLRESMRLELVKIHQMMKSTTIYVTHDQLEAMTMATKIVVMNDAKIQQVDTAKSLYYRPKNLFVAKFIGSPTMNLVEGKVINDFFVSSDQVLNIKLDSKQLKVLKTLKLDKIIIGVRSEDIEITQVKTANALKLTIVEMLGKEQQIQLEANTTKLTVTISSDIDLVIDKMYYLDFKLAKIHFFNPITTENIFINS